MGDVRNTPLFEKHKELGCKMAPFANWNMPINYAPGIIAEHEHTRKMVSVFDICHMGEFRFAGTGAAQKLDFVFARPVSDQKVGTCRYNFLLNQKGGVIDDLIVYRMEEEDFFVVVNAGNIKEDFEQISSRLPEDIVREDLSDLLGKLDLQGPLAAQVMEKLGIAKTDLPEFFRCKKMAFDGKNFIVSRTGYTGELGFEIYGANDNIVELWDKLLAIEPVRPAGLGARDTLRLEAALALYGHELDQNTTPLEAGYGFMLKLDESPARDFFGREALLKRPVNKTLVGIRLDGRRAARSGARIFHNGEEAGIVTSGAYGPSVGAAVALGYVKNSLAAEGTLLELEIPNGKLPGKVCKLPFYTEGTLRAKI